MGEYMLNGFEVLQLRLSLPSLPGRKCAFDPESTELSSANSSEEWPSMTIDAVDECCWKFILLAMFRQDLIALGFTDAQELTLY